MDSRNYGQDFKYTNITIEEALVLLKEHIACGAGTQQVPLEEALLHIAAEDVTAPFAQPPFARSPLDGYALAAADTAGACKEKPVRLRVAAEIAAGETFSGRIGAAEAVRIMTGAPIPEGADCVIRQEDTDYGKEQVSICRELSRYDNYCRAGEDFEAGERLIAAGTKITAVELGILASMGCASVKVRSMPRIALVTTGDELVEPAGTLGPGKIYNSNRYVLWGRFAELGMHPELTEHMPDDEVRMAERLCVLAARTDLIVTTGGVSVGKRDIMHAALGLAGARKIFWRIQIKPGMPVMFAMIEDTPVLALSGNPYGALAHFEVLVRPLLAHMTGCTALAPVREHAVMEQDFGKNTVTRRLVRARVEDGAVRLPDSHSSGVLGSMRGCNCLVDVPAGSSPLRAGDVVEIVRL